MELLAHVSAAATNKGDDLFRAQLANHLDFVPERVTSLTGLGLSGARDGEVGAAALEDGRGMSASPLQFVDDTQLAISALESQIITNSLRDAILDSSLGPSQALDAVEYTGNRPSDDNSTEATTQIEQTSPEEPASSNPALSARVPQIGHLKISPRKSTGSSTWSSGQDVPVELPSSYSISDDARGSQSQAQIPTIPASHDQTTAIPVRIPSPVRHGHALRPEDADKLDENAAPESGQTTQTDPVPTAAEAEDEPDPSSIEVSARRQQSIPTAHQASPTSDQLATTQEAAAEHSTPYDSGTRTFADLPLSVRPPPPPTSMDPAPPTLITKALADLVSNPSLSDRYKPKHVRREPRPRERGYWDFHPAGPHWTPRAQAQMWRFLTRIIEDGSAGWGTWCARENEGMEDRLGRVRVFCWGETAGHVYLLLYVASNSKVKKDGLVWRDAGGEAVVCM